VAHTCATARPVTWTTRRTSAAFFDFVPRRLEDLDLHRLPAQRALQLADALLRGPQLAGRHHLAVGRHCRLAALREELLPSLNQRAADAQLAAELRDRDLALQDAVDLLVLELRRVEPPAVGGPCCRCHPAPPG
jgi:hypothetical protein